ncbi:hypothetical protein [Lutibacter sp.]|uniref:hypothetical protein n=1 Tax=Lutibacter sp. TaxID=1925666 RepID=UPI003566BE47
MNIPYNTTDFAFTLDDSQFLNISTVNENTYFTLEMVVKYYDFYSAIEKTETLNYKIPLFQKAAQFNVGRIIHRLLSNIQQLNNTEPQYKTALVKITLQEFAFNDSETVVSSEIVDGIQFIAGFKPNLIEGNFAILNSNIEASRVTPNGITNISFLLPTGTHQLELSKNNVVLNTETIVITSLNNVITKRIKVSDYNATPGDVFKYLIKTKDVFKNIVVFPKQPRSNQLFFINEFKLLDTLECTGEYSFPIKYNQTTKTYKRNWVNVDEVIQTTKENSFNINTGWVLKSDIVTMDSLMLSKKAWLFINENEVIELVPIPKKIDPLTSDKFLYEYDLEFKINKTSDAQNYTL